MDKYSMIMCEVVYHKTLEVVKKDILEINTPIFRIAFLDDKGEEKQDNDKLKYFKVFDDNNVYLFIEICKGYRDDNDYNCGRLGCFIKQFIIEKAFLNSEDCKTALIYFEEGIESMQIRLPNGYKTRYNYIFSVKDAKEECISAKFIGLDLVHQNEEFSIYSKDLK